MANLETSYAARASDTLDETSIVTDPVRSEINDEGPRPSPWGGGYMIPRRSEAGSSGETSDERAMPLPVRPAWPSSARATPENRSLLRKQEQREDHSRHREKEDGKKALIER